MPHTISKPTVRSFTFDRIDGHCPMEASGTINGEPWEYRLEARRETLEVAGQEVYSMAIPKGLIDGEQFGSVFTAEQIEFIVQRLMRAASEGTA